MSLPVERLPGGVARVTAKGQITIPKALRRALGIREGCDILFVPVKGEVMVRVLPPVPKAAQLAGSLKLRAGFDMQALDDIAAESVLAHNKVENTKK